MDYRVATSADVDAMTETITLAFAGDPTWGPVLAPLLKLTGDLRPFWRTYVLGSLRFDTAYLTDGASAVALWTPPGETELSDELEAQVDDWFAQLAQPDGHELIDELYARFEAAHPHAPHAYLGILATHPSHRGHGLAQQLLAETLKMWDAQQVPCYLESSNRLSCTAPRPRRYGTKN